MSPEVQEVTEPARLEDGGNDFQRMCLVVGGEPAYEFATACGLPVQTYCGDWLYPDVLDEIEATVGPTINCPTCDAARADELRRPS